MIKVTFPPRLKTVINDNVVTPILTHPHTAAWHKEIASKLLADDTFDNLTKDYHRFNLCGQGQADFRGGNAGLTAEDITLLYTFYFFQMHFTSSVALYYKYQDELVSIFQNSSTITFIDIGCGPFTSGFAFLYFTQLQGISEKITSRKGKTQLEYFGIDNANSMWALGHKMLSDYQPLLTDNEFRYEDATVNPDFKSIPQLIGKVSADTSIIINCCYFFASETLNVVDFTTAIQELLTNNPHSKVLFMYQNAPTDASRVGSKYSNFRQAIKGLTAVGMNVEELGFSYDDEFKAAKRATLNLRVRYQLLKNY